jgi:3-hydroxyacyl-CoA dehydrogenase
MASLESRRISRQPKNTISLTTQVVFNRITTTTDLTDVVGDATFVIEATPEQIELKKLFIDLDARAEEDIVLGTNTSALPITEIARQLGLHDSLDRIGFEYDPRLAYWFVFYRALSVAVPTNKYTGKLSPHEYHDE